ncbi:acyl-ACP--UDP-N-acetylglucosamine O-acyltransferase [Amycolatopsis rhabdoformis]|uniref:Acyl-ACP--UDP-N-acetylglucosamine O-acyltransferase n=1 Tax=Amycolatopsis rhabdoformis TaxID=1448059 RepID=A0ABZ1I6H0_9PSEU|nr:acyl-ACP--UDP-N-acetylglucosamine O-acyltransferase [Amycolatopsis rhabdoformis]WSE29955.1 acyl-ACP--UDP-N-acetylglucosamine O-acyltransferase [Amycolatopsis rhabdoformis]
MTHVHSPAADAGSIDATAVVDTRAEIHPRAVVGPWCRVGPGVRIGAGTRLLSHVVVEGPAVLGEDVVVHPFSVLGGAAQQRRQDRAEERRDAELGRLVIGDRATIREYVTVNRSTHDGRPTTIGADCMLLAGAHVGHDSVVGEGSILANGAQVAGHVALGGGVRLAGMSGVTQRARVGRLSFVAGFGGVTRDVPPFAWVAGTPASVRKANRVGLRRAGLDDDAVDAVSAAVEIWRDQELPVVRRLELLAPPAANSAEVREFLEFVTAPSDLGSL